MDYKKIKTTSPNEIPYADEIMEKIDKDKRDREEDKRKSEENKKNKIKLIEEKYKEQIISKIAEYINHSDGKSFNISLNKLESNLKMEEFVNNKDFSEIVLKIAKDELILKGYNCKINKKLEHEGRRHGKNYKNYKYYLDIKISTCYIC